MDSERERIEGLWLEICNVRIDEFGETDEKVWVQFSGDKADVEPAWWPMHDPSNNGDKTIKVGRHILEKLDKKTVVLGRIKCPDCPARVIQKLVKDIKKSAETLTEIGEMKEAVETACAAASDTIKKASRDSKFRCALWCTDVRFKYSEATSR